jgi:hypothetical protein
MKTEKYVYNKRTLQFEKHSLSLGQRILKLSGNLLGICFGGVVLFLLSSNYFPSPKERAMSRELDQMSYQLQHITSEFENVATDLDELHQKDVSVHRMILGVDPIDEDVWEGGIGGHEKNPYLINYTNTGDLLNSSLNALDRLKRKMDLQKLSFDTLQQLASAKEEKLASIPSIKPIQEDKLKRNIKYLSGYGIRIHPIHKIRKLHAGLDFTSPRGTPIIASGNGKVVRIENKRSGYGRNVTIDHGYGYTTLYAHMQEVLVKKGEEVKRGQVIGKVGSSGTSTAPHLHYEVRINGKSVDPIDYCLDGLTLDEYKELVHKASEENQSFD